MKIHVLANLLLVLVIVEHAKSASLTSKLLSSMLSTEDIEKFNSTEGLWFLNDDGEYVQATLDLPSELYNILTSVDNHVSFNLFTRDTGNNSEIIYIDDLETLKNSSFDATRETKFVTHGWMNSKNSKSCMLIKHAYLKLGDYNIIVVDWSKITLRPYVWASMHVVSVGKYVAKMIDFLEEQGIDLETTTLSGHSLGAHVMGLAGYYAKNKVNYIVGLDPALPLFSLAGVGSRISSEDAKQVEIIHTNAGNLGYLIPIGKADFYPNGGKKQLGCAVDLAGACSHSRSYEFFAESILSDVGFYGMNCKNYSSYEQGTCAGDVVLMGGAKIDLPNTGTYYLDTASDYPYAKGKA